MDELTEREKKLIESIQTLMTIVSIMSTYRMGIYKWCDWLDKLALEFKMAEKEEAILEYLKLEFGLNYTKLDPFAKEEQA
jgi:hypothetical protein